MDNELISAEQLADRLGLAERTVLDWARRGLIPELRLSPRIRRFDYGEVVAALRGRRGKIHGAEAHHE